MNIIITGGTGMIGRAFRKEMVSAGHKIFVLSRSGGGDSVKWDGCSTQGWADLVEQADAIVNLAGENIGAGRWTRERKQRILESRLEAGHAVVEAICGASRKPSVLLQASAVGYYGVPGDRVLDEDSLSGDDWLAEISRKWEDSTASVDALGVRRIVLRTGVVLGKGEGILPRFQLPFRFFAGGPMGSGRQFISWIHLLDQVQAMRFLLESPFLSGAFNLTAPQPETNTQFGKTLGRVMRRPFWLPVPAFALKMVLGEMSTLVLDGQRVISTRLQKAGFLFEYSDLQSALENIIL